MSGLCEIEDQLHLQVQAAALQGRFWNKIVLATNRWHAPANLVGLRGWRRVTPSWTPRTGGVSASLLRCTFPAVRLPLKWPIGWSSSFCRLATCLWKSCVVENQKLALIHDVPLLLCVCMYILRRFLRVIAGFVRDLRFVFFWKVFVISQCSQISSDFCCIGQCFVLRICSYFYFSKPGMPG